MLESIGILTLVAVIIYFILYNQKINDDKKNIRGEMIRNSWTCQALINEYNKSLENDKLTTSSSDLQKKITQILIDEKEEILQRMKTAEDYNKSILERNRINRKFGYKHEENVFKIFSSSRELSIIEITERIINLKLSENNLNVDDIINNWLLHRLIEKCPWNESKFQIGYILTDIFFKIDKEDIIWSEWLENNKIVLKPISQEYHNYVS